MRLKQLIFLGSILMAFIGNSQNTLSKKDIKKLKLDDGIYAKIETNRGDILLYLESDEVPMTVANFVGLSEGDFQVDTLVFTTPYYDGLLFHRVIPNFMIQGGDPNGNGSGGPGYSFYDEFSDSLKHDGPGIISMANSGANTNGSQFFITHKETPWLDGKHSVFGHVVVGQEVVNSVEQNDTIQHIEIIRVGKTAKKFNATEVFNTKYNQLKSEEEAAKKVIENRLAMTPQEAREYFYNLVKEKESKAVQSASGLVYVINRAGNGEMPQRGQKVTVNYLGTLFSNGDKFDSSYDRNQAFSFNLQSNQVIRGWDEGVALMSKGSKFTLYIPYWLAYGSMARGPIIKPYSDLVFEIELIDFI